MNRSQGTKCTICNEVIVDQSASYDGEDAIYCKGSCAAWMHRHCVRLSVPQFAQMSSNSKPFLCVYCTLLNQALEINELKRMVQDLMAKPLETATDLPPAPTTHVTAKPPTANPHATQLQNHRMIVDST